MNHRSPCGQLATCSSRSGAVAALAIVVTALTVSFPSALAAQSDTGSVGPRARLGESPRASIRAERRDGDLRIDGRLDEAAWAAATPARDFTQSYPNPGAPATDSMSVRVLYDNSAIYVGVRMYDSHPDSIAAQLARRDATGIYSDWIHVIIDSYYDRRTAFRFSLNPLGVQKDVYTSNDGSEDTNWDAVWESAARVDEQGWVAELRVPLSQLRYASMDTSAVRTWGFQVMRDVARRNERDAFAPWTPQSPGFVSQFGDLTGLDALPTSRRVELVPYLSARAVREPGLSSNPFYHSTDVTPNVGADVRYGLPGGFTLTGTINPDFGQVEVDPAVVNLSAFETFFPEKRPFFLEGSDVFAFGRVRSNNSYNSTTFLYSRRIGGSPILARAVGAAPGVAYVDAPEQTRILGAAKVTGKRAGWTIGLLDAVTNRETAHVALDDGSRDDRPAEPRTNFLAARVRRDLRGGRTVIGAMVTNTARDMGDDVFLPVLPTRSSFGGVDFEHGWSNRQWYVSGYAGYSRVDGSTQLLTSLQRNSTHQYQRPDAGYLDVDPNRTSLDGGIMEVALERSGNVFGSISWKDVSPGFDVNDFGFHGRVDYRALSSLIGHSTNQRGRVFRSSSAYLYQNAAWNHGGNIMYDAVSASANATFNNFWSVNAGTTLEASAYDDRLTRGGPLARTPQGWSANAGIGSDGRRLIVAGLSTQLSHDASGAHSTSLSLDLSARPTSNLNVTVGPSYRVGESTSQYVLTRPDPLATATYGARYVFADLRQTTLSLDTRVEWTLTPTLSVQTYVQPFVAVGRFERFKEFQHPGSYDFAVYGADQGTIEHDPAAGQFTIDPDGAGAAESFALGDPTFNTRSLRGNAVVRWQYRPGSALFFVWQQQRSDFEPTGDFRAGHDVESIFQTRPTNVFLVKATWWLGK